MRKRAYVHIKFDYILDFELKFHNFVSKYNLSMKPLQLVLHIMGNFMSFTELCLAYIEGEISEII